MQNPSPQAFVGPHSLFLPLVTYPGADYHEVVSAAAGHLAALDAEAARLLADYLSFIATRTVEELQELFAGTFDMDPECTLDLGWHLFGEDQKRCVYLVKVRHELTRHGIPENGELPDHLTHALPTLERMAPAEAGWFANACVLPALRQVIASLEARNSPFLPVYLGLVDFLQRQHPPLEKGVDHA